MANDESGQLNMRSDKLADLVSGDTVRASRALLFLTYEDPDRKWLESLLLDQLNEDVDPQLRALAVTCMGHIGRMRGVVGGRIVSALEGLVGDVALGGIAEDALGDIRHFAVVE